MEVGENEHVDMCGTCRFGYPVKQDRGAYDNPGGKPAEMVQCLRYPPSIPVQRYGYTGYTGPVIAPGNWCGEYAKLDTSE